MQKNERPLLIVTSSTRNYGWVTRAFLEGNTRWADYIVIVDQMSTDGTREMCAEYASRKGERIRGLEGEGICRANVIIVDDPDMAYKENTRAKMAFMKGRELAAGRDAIYFALDIDEVMPANWMNTGDGQKILASHPGDMFQLEWANIMPDGKNCNRCGWQYKVFHDNGMAWQDAGIQMHTPLLPYSSWDDKNVIPVKDFPLLHFGQYHKKWIHYKSIYYQFLDMCQRRSKNIVALYRTYHSSKKSAINIQNIALEWLYSDVDIIRLVDVVSDPIFISYIKELIKEHGALYFQALDVWTEEFCHTIGEKDPRSLIWKCVHFYLRKTQPYSNTYMTRVIDGLLKHLTRWN